VNAGRSQAEQSWKTRNRLGHEGDYQKNDNLHHDEGKYLADQTGHADIGIPSF
jgi:hypothetical protein